MVTWGDVARRLREPVHAAALVVAVVAVPLAVTLLLPAADRPAEPRAGARASRGALVVVPAVPTGREAALSPAAAASILATVSAPRARRNEEGAVGPDLGAGPQPAAPGDGGEPAPPPLQAQGPVQQVSSAVDSTSEPVRQIAAAAVTAVDEVVVGLEEVAGPLPPP